VKMNGVKMKQQNRDTLEIKRSRGRRQNGARSPDQGCTRTNVAAY